MKKYVTACGVALALLGTAMAAPAVAQEGAAEEAQSVDPKVVSQVKELLAGYEYTPTAADWARIGDDAAVVLRQIAADESARATQRARAVSSLAHFPGDETRVFLKDLLAQDGSPALLRRKAIRAMAVGFGASSLEVIKPFLTNDDKRLRESAVLALGTIKGIEAQTLLKERLEVEPSAFLKETIKKTLTKMDAP